MSQKKTRSIMPQDVTHLIHGKYFSQSWNFDQHLLPPMTGSTSFRLESLERGAEGFLRFAGLSKKKTDQPILIYDRLDEPDTMLLEERLTQLERGECAVSFSSGMGAISTALLAVLNAGQTVVAHQTLYGCTHTLLSQWLSRFDVRTQFINLNDGSRKHLWKDKSVRVVFFETVSNPNLELIDIPSLMKDIRAENQKRKANEKIIVIVDNTFPTPLGIRPLEWGVDMVIHSLTKHICGFGTEMGGIVITKKKWKNLLRWARKDFGANLHASSAWHILVYGLSTFHVRFAEQQKNAMKIARFLESHSKMGRVLYPGLPSFPQYSLARQLLKGPDGAFNPGTMISFQLKGNQNVCRHFVNDVAAHAYSITLAVSLGLTKTLIEVPGFMTHSALSKKARKASGIDPRAIRLSVGLEAVEDVIGDLERSLKHVRTKR